MSGSIGSTDSIDSIRAIRSGSARLRLAAVSEFLHQQPADAEVLLVGASRGAVDDCARAVASTRGVSFGLHRLSVAQLAARLAALDLAARGETPITRLGFDALAARATFEAVHDDKLEYLRAVHATPGFPRALAATLTELRMRRAGENDLRSLDRRGADLAVLLHRVEAWLDQEGMSDRAALFDAAIARLRNTDDFAGMPIVLLDVSFDSSLSIDLFLTLVRRASSALITIPAGDLRADEALRAARIPVIDEHETADTDLTRLQLHLFADAPPQERSASGEMIWMSAPGEARECVELARCVMQEAGRGVAFDQMAVLLRSPQQYVGLLEHAFDRAGIPAHFDRGTRRPDPAGRAFLALLSSAAEGLSAKRFAEYLSLGQVPVDDREPDEDSYIVADDDGLGLVVPDDEAAPRAADTGDADAGPPRISAPWRWERLLVESSVIGGADRWQRRINGLAGQLRMRIAALTEDDPDDARIDRVARDLEDLRALQSFALPIIQDMAAWPARGSWGEWIDALEPFARRVLKQPDRVLQALESFRPMDDVGPVSLAEVRDVLADPLASLYDPPSAPRYGQVFVAALDEARGRVFRTVFVPGLAERVFPRVIREDPLLADDLRAEIGELTRQDDRAALERLALRLAVGAATERVYVSFPRLDATGGRARVPSFYALELIRAVTGVVPDSTQLQERAAETSGAALAWPAPREAGAAIDDFEHDLSVLRTLMMEGSSAKGKAQYIVQLNPHLRRSLTSQYQRARATWTSADGLVRSTGDVRAFLDTQRLGARAYSASALQHYAACPYRFLLSAIYRLAPIEEPEPLQRLDPLNRGSFFHRVQADLFRVLAAESLLLPRANNRARVKQLLDDTIDQVAADFADLLAPAIDRVWRDEIGAMRRDLSVWIEQVIQDEQWEPWRFEFAFGLAERQGHDEHSLRDPVTIDGRFTLRGSIDLVEKKRGAESLRVTDYKTSRNRLKNKPLTVGGGAILQPVLYSLAAEAATKMPAESARLWFCTTAGGFSQQVVPITDAARRQGLEVLEIVDRAIELGIFPAAPSDKACSMCDFRRVCGPNEERRTRVKAQELIGDLIVLRGMS
jgi:ATP-dependent helicase/nuclease subunit B